MTLGQAPTGLLERLLAPAAVTVVGASPNGHITHHLLRNLQAPSLRFAGPVHLVNPAYRRIFDRDCLGSVDEVAGAPGLVYLLVRPEACLPALEALRSRADGVVLFPDASRQPDGYEAGIAAWGREHRVAVLGPQSNGLISTAGRLHGLLIPIVEDLAPGPVAVLAQSGGVLGGIVKFLGEKRIGIHSALEYGTACMLTPWDLGSWLVKREEVRLLALYADGLDSVTQFAELLAAARAVGTPVVAMVAGASDAARRAAASHSGMAATPRRVLEGVAAQHGAILAGSLDELAWSVEAIAAAGYSPPRGPRIALFSDSGGGGIVLAEALAAQGVNLTAPNDQAREQLAGRFGDVLNPFDFGSASMGQVREQAADVRAVATDSDYGVLAFASTIGLGIREQSVHMTQIEDFIATAAEAGRIPFIASPLPFLSEPDALRRQRAIYGNGSTESAVKMRALATWAGGGTGPGSVAEEGAPEGEVDVLTGGPAQDHLAGLPLRWPRTIIVARLADLDPTRVVFPVVAKTEAGLAHRARQGGVLVGIENERDLRHAIAYLLGRFGGSVSVSEQVPHRVEYFLGAQRQDDAVLILLGGGGEAAESARLRLAPLAPDDALAFARESAGEHAEPLAELVLSFQEWVLATPWVAAVDLNPVVPTEAGLTALDAKIHRR